MEELKIPPVFSKRLFETPDDPPTVEKIPTRKGDNLPIVDKRSLELCPGKAVRGYPCQSIVVGQEYEVYVTTILATNEVYVRLSDSNVVLSTIRDMIDSDTIRPFLPFNNPARAAPILAKFCQDGRLHRAVIKSFAKFLKGEIDVFFVDCGFSNVVALSEVYAISPKLLEIPVQAIHVILTDMPDFPKDMNAYQPHLKNEAFTLKPIGLAVDEASVFSAVSNFPCVYGTLTFPERKSITEAVMSDPPSFRAPSLSAPEPVAVSSSTKITHAPQKVERPDGERGKLLQPARDTYECCWVERLDLLVGQTLSAKVVEKLDTDLYSLEASGCRGLVFPASSEVSVCSGSSLSAGDEVVVRVVTLSQDRLLVKFFDKNGKSLTGGSSVRPILPMPIFKRKALITICHKEREFLYIHSESHEDLLANMLDQMYEYYEANDASCEFKVGDLCAAHFFDGNWYRGRIEAINVKCTVHLLDYGNTEEVALDQIKTLSDVFMSPEFCVRVALPCEYVDIESCFGFLSDAPLQCTFIKTDVQRNCWIVDLSDLDAEDNFAQIWIQNNKARAIASIPANPRVREPGWDFKKGDTISIRITRVENRSPYVFWVQLRDHLLDISNLQRKLQKIPSDNTELGDVFVAKYAADGSWNRAVLCGRNVRFIDFGDIRPTLERKKLPEDLLHPISGYAFQVRLCVKPVGAFWTLEATQIIEDFLNRQEDSPDGLKAEILSVDFETVVDLKLRNESLSSVLISGGHAIPAPPGPRCKTPGPTNVPNHAAKNFRKPSETFGAKIVQDELPRDTVEVSLSTVNSIHDFYVQLYSKMDTVAMLTEHLKDAADLEAIEDPEVGENLIAKFPDNGQWYRAKVISKEPHQVQYLDYGNVSASSEFRKLPLYLANIPRLAWSCCVETNDPQLDEKFKNFVLEDATFDVSFTGRKSGTKHIVRLYVYGESIFTVKPFKANDVTVEGEKKAVSLAPVTSCNPDSIQDNIKHTEEDVFPVTIPYATSPSDFYYHVDSAKVSRLSSILVNAEKFVPVDPDSCQIGELLCAKYTEDESWYRAEVISTNPVKVFFIDYGNISEVDELRRLPTSVSDLAPLALKASLFPDDRVWTPEQIDVFLDIVYSVELKCTLLEEKPDLDIVRLETPSGDLFTTYLENLEKPS